MSGALSLAASPLNMIGGTTRAVTGGGLGTLGNLTGLFGGTGQPQATVNYQMDPTAAGIYQGALGQYKNLMSQYQGGAESPYVQSQLSPALQTGATQYGNLLQSQGLRGIRGSSFGDQDIANLTSAQNRNIADIQAQAQQQQLASQMGLLGAQTDIGRLYQQQGMGAMQGALGWNEALMRADEARRQANAQMFGGLMSGISGMDGGGGGGGDVTSSIPSNYWIGGLGGTGGLGSIGSLTSMSYGVP